MKISIFPLSPILFTVFGISTAGAAVVFSENFGTLADGTTLTSSNTVFTPRIGTGTGTNTMEAQNPGSWAGSSALLAAATTSETNLKKGSLTTIDVGTLSFSLKTNALGGSSIFWFGFGNGTSFTANSGFTGNQLLAAYQITSSGQLQARTGNGTTQGWSNVGSALSANTTYDFSIVFNGSVSDVTDYQGTNDVAAGTADIWIGNTLFGNDVDIIDAQSLTAIKFYTTSSGGTAYELDNIVLNDAATISSVPEPAAALLGSIGLLGLLRRRRF